MALADNFLDGDSYFALAMYIDNTVLSFGNEQENAEQTSDDYGTVDAQYMASENDHVLQELFRIHKHPEAHAEEGANESVDKHPPAEPQTSSSEGMKKRPGHGGRPKGSKNKPKPLEAERIAKQNAPKNPLGRPHGSKDKQPRKKRSQDAQKAVTRKAPATSDPSDDTTLLVPPQTILDAERAAERPGIVTSNDGKFSNEKAIPGTADQKHRFFASQRTGPVVFSHEIINGYGTPRSPPRSAASAAMGVRRPMPAPAPAMAPIYPLALVYVPPPMYPLAPVYHPPSPAPLPFHLPTPPQEPAYPLPPAPTPDPSVLAAVDGMYARAPDLLEAPYGSYCPCGACFQYLTDRVYWGL